MSLSDELRSVLGDFIRVIEEAERNGSFGSDSGGSETSTSRRSYRRNGESRDDWVNRRFEEINNPSWGGHREIYKKELEEIKKSREELEKKLKVDKDNVELKEKYIEVCERQSDVEGKLKQYSKINQLKQISTHVKNIGGAFNSLLEPWAKINQAASNYARSVGMSVTGMKNLQKETQKAVTSQKIALKYNMGSDELLKAQQDYLKGAGRSIRISAEEQEDLAATHSVMQGREGEFFVQYEKFGQNISSTAEHLHDMFQTASREGISFEKYSDNVAKNIRLAQTYTFRNGLKGLEDMAKKATAIRLDMQQVANFAENVSTVEGAITTGAKLQVLGGSFAQFADPLGMLNEGLNDLEGLQDRMVNMYGSLGQLNKQTGEIDISAFNKRRIKEAAKAMGVDPGAMMDSIFAKTRQNEIEAQMAGNANVQNLSEGMRELIKNTGTFKDGKAGVSIAGKFKSLDELTEEDYGALRAESNDDSDNIRDLAVSMRSFNEMKSGFSKQTSEYQASVLRWLGWGIRSLMAMQGLMTILAGVNTAKNIAGGAMEMGQNIWDIFKMFKGGKGVRNAKAALLKGGRKFGRAFSKPVGWVKGG